MSDSPSTAPPDDSVFDSLMREHRVFPPPAEFASKARIGSAADYEAMYKRSVEDPAGFWGEAAMELDWFSPWTTVQEGSGADAKWFLGGQLNLAHNCVDRHASSERRDKPALIWEGEPGETRKLTFADLAFRSTKVRERTEVAWCAQR